MRLKFGIRSLMALAAFGTLLSAMGTPASAQAMPMPVVITADPVNLPNWVLQAGNMAKSLADDAARYTQLAQQITQGEQNLKELGALASGSLGSMQKFTNFVVTAQNEYPTTAGYDLATTIVAAQNGSLSSDNLDLLKSKVDSAKGNMEIQASIGNILLAQLTQSGNQAVYDAAKLKMEQAQIQDAVKQRAELLDTNSPPTAGMLY